MITPVTRKMAEVAGAGADLHSPACAAFCSRPGSMRLHRREVICKTLINCAGLQSDLIAACVGAPGAADRSPREAHSRIGASSW